MSYFTDFKTAMFDASPSQVLAVAQCFLPAYNRVYKPVIEVLESLEAAHDYINKAAQKYIAVQTLNHGETLRLEEVAYSSIPHRPLYECHLGTLKEPLTFSDTFKATKNRLPVVVPKIVHRDADGEILTPIAPELRVYQVGDLDVIPICQPHEVYWCSTWK